MNIAPSMAGHPKKISTGAPLKARHKPVVDHQSGSQNKTK